MDTAAGQSRRIWLCADDYGLSPGVSAAIRDLVQRGRLNATSVMVVTPAINKDEAAALSALNDGRSRVAIGLHLTLTAPFCPLTADYGPRRDGTFLLLGTTLGASMLRLLRTDRIAAEVRAQIERFTDLFGAPPAFVDGHQHVQLFPKVREAVLQVVKRDLPHAWVRQCGRIGPLSARLSDRKGLLLDMLSTGFRERADKLGVAVNPAFAGSYAFTPDADFASLFPRFLEGLPEGSVVMCHPGFVDDELRRLDPLTGLREREHAFFAGEAFPRILSAAGITLW